MNNFDNKDSDSGLSYKEKRRKAASIKRHKDQMSVTIFGIIIYSIVLILIVVFSYMGFKKGIGKLQEKRAIEAEEKRLAEEEEKAAAEEAVI